MRHKERERERERKKSSALPLTSKKDVVDQVRKTSNDCRDIVRWKMEEGKRKDERSYRKYELQQNVTLSIGKENGQSA